jgi:hypothetical protein
MAYSELYSALLRVGSATPAEDVASAGTALIGNITLPCASRKSLGTHRHAP